METGKNLQINKDKIHELIHGSNQILLTTHENPDGDGLGSQIAMYNHLKSLNKDCRIINISQISDNFQFLNDNEQYKIVIGIIIIILVLAMIISFIDKDSFSSKNESSSLSVRGVITI